MAATLLYYGSSGGTVDILTALGDNNPGSVKIVPGANNQQVSIYLVPGS